MRILANENVPRGAVEALRERGHDVQWVRTEAPGASDSEVIERARSDGRILVTFDKDFGDLARRVHLPASCGVILFRIRMDKPGAATSVASVIDARTDWAGHFSVVEAGRVRMTPLETGGGARE